MSGSGPEPKKNENSRTSAIKVDQTLSRGASTAACDTGCMQTQKCDPRRERYSWARSQNRMCLRCGDL